MGTLVILLGVVSVIEAVFIIFLIYKSLGDKNQMKKVISQAEELKKRRVDIDDLEISDTASSHGAIGDAINVIKNNLQTFLEATKGNVVVLSDAIDVLSEGSEKNKDGSQQLSASLSEIVNKIQEQQDLVGSCLTLIEENTEQLTDIDSSAKNIGGILNESAESCKIGVGNLENYENKMKFVSDNLEQSEVILREFSERLSEINSIGSFIVDMSESLQLLALNASIEVARVGEAGKGFAVVTREMSEMSEKTLEGIGSINEILANVSESSERVNQSIHECAKVFAESRREFDEVSASFRTIDRQSGEINEKMQDISSKIDTITGNSRATKEKAMQAFRASEEATSGTEEIASVSELTAETSSKISENVGSLDSMLKGIQNLLKQFTTSVVPVPSVPGKKVKIGVLCILDNDFWYSVRRGIVYARKELEDYNAEVRYVPFTDWEKAKKMPELVDEMIAEGFDGFIFPGFMDGAMDNIRKAHNSGKKVYCFNCDCAQAKDRDACFQPDVFDQGVIAARSLDKALKRSGKVIALVGDETVDVNKQRFAGFMKELSKYPGIKVAETIKIEDNEQDTYNKAVAALQRNPDATGMYITTGTPLAAARAIEDSGRKVSLVVFDHSDEIFKFIKKGIIAAAIGQDPFGQGHDPIVWMYNSIMSGQKTPSEIMKCRVNVVDGGNVNSMLN
ncbi:MAG: substrate-binding domain-containing protein [Lachnospiraceae bacterium]|nr:substrate-binding domain-containing protein [Lachnospiraceae bacterium]